MVKKEENGLANTVEVRVQADFDVYQICKP